jgi:hypothetical protein
MFVPTSACPAQVKMLLGILPSETLLQQYKLMEYAGVARAVRSGDVAALQSALDTHQVMPSEDCAVMRISSCVLHWQHIPSIGFPRWPSHFWFVQFPPTPPTAHTQTDKPIHPFMCSGGAGAGGHIPAAREAVASSIPPTVQKVCVLSCSLVDAHGSCRACSCL